MTDKKETKLEYGQRRAKDAFGQEEIRYANMDTWVERMETLQEYNQTVKVVIQLDEILDIENRKIVRVGEDYLEVTNTSGRGTIIIERPIIRIVEADEPEDKDNEEPK